MPEPLLRLQGVTLRAMDGRPLFQALDWALAPGRRVTLHADPGAGASAFLRLCAGLLEPEAGAVWLEDRPFFLGALDHPLPRRGDLGYVPSTGGLAVNLSLRDNVALPLRFARRMAREAAQDEAGRWLAEAGLTALMDQRPRVPADRSVWLASLCRAAAKGARLLLVDRPPGSLDPADRRVVDRLLTQACADPALALVVAAGVWDPGPAAGIRLQDGRVIEEEAP